MNFNAGAMRQPIVGAYASTSQVHSNNALNRSQQSAARASNAAFQFHNQAHQYRPNGMSDHSASQISRSHPIASRTSSHASKASPFNASGSLQYTDIPHQPPSSENAYVNLPIFGKKPNDNMATQENTYVGLPIYQNTSTDTKATQENAYVTLPLSKPSVYQNLPSLSELAKLKSNKQVSKKGATRRSTLESFANQIHQLSSQVSKLPPRKQAKAQREVEKYRNDLAQMLRKEFIGSTRGVRSSVIVKYVQAFSKIMNTAGIKDPQLSSKLEKLQDASQAIRQNEIISLKRSMKTFEPAVGKMLRQNQSEKTIENAMHTFDNLVYTKLLKLDARESSVILNHILRQETLSPKLRAHIEKRTLKLMKIRYKSIFKKRLAELQTNPTTQKRTEIKKQIRVLNAYAKELYLSPAASNELETMLKYYSAPVVKYRK
jgi:hypothetical protein